MLSGLCSMCGETGGSLPDVDGSLKEKNKPMEACRENLYKIILVQPKNI